MRTWLSIGVLLVLLPSCGGGLPARYVLERDVGEWSYRRYQRVLDVEIAIEGNPAEGHTATYVRRAGRTRGGVPFANVFVAVYGAAPGLAAEARRQVQGLASYEVAVRSYGGGHVWYLDGGAGDRWALWVSGRHIVKVGAGAALDRVPEDVVGAYMSLYPSDLDAHGRARPGTASEGDAVSERPAGQDETPSFLEENAPR